MKRYRIRLYISPGTPVRTQIRIAVMVLRFTWKYLRSTPEQQKAIFAFLDSQPGVEVSRTTGEGS